MEAVPSPVTSPASIEGVNRTKQAATKIPPIAEVTDIVPCVLYSTCLQSRYVVLMMRLIVMIQMEPQLHIWCVKCMHVCACAHARTCLCVHVCVYVCVCVCAHAYFGGSRASEGSG